MVNKQTSKQMAKQPHDQTKNIYILWGCTRVIQLAVSVVVPMLFFSG